MQNVNIAVKGTTLTITVDLSKNLGPSKSGKTQLIASTQGNVPVDAAGKVGIVSLGLNLYRKI